MEAKSVMGVTPEQIDDAKSVIGVTPEPIDDARSVIGVTLEQLKTLSCRSVWRPKV